MKLLSNLIAGCVRGHFAREDVLLHNCAINAPTRIAGDGQPSAFASCMTQSANQPATQQGPVFSDGDAYVSRGECMVPPQKDNPQQRPSFCVELRPAQPAAPRSGRVEYTSADELVKDVQDLRWLGQGAQGVVYEGCWQGATVAVKFSIVEDLDTTAYELLFSRLLSHPNVVQTFVAKVAVLDEKTIYPSTDSCSILDSWRRAPDLAAFGPAAAAAVANSALYHPAAGAPGAPAQGPGGGCGTPAMPLPTPSSSRHHAQPPSHHQHQRHLHRQGSRGGTVGTNSGVPTGGTGSLKAGSAGAARALDTGAGGSSGLVKVAVGGSAAGAGAVAGRTDSFHSDDGFGDPFGRRSTFTDVREVLASMGAKPGHYITQMVMEHCDHGSLHAAIQRCIFKPSSRWGPKLALRALIRTVREVAQGMFHLHSNNVLHGDLKPANVLLINSRKDRRGYIAKVSDFGLAQFCSQDHISNAPWGTLVYMAPERLLHGQLFPASDVYSFGVMLWEMYHGQRPYEGMHAAQIVMACAQGTATLEWAPDACEDVVRISRRCTAPGIRDRPTFEQLMRELAFLEARIRLEGSRTSTSMDLPSGSSALRRAATAGTPQRVSTDSNPYVGSKSRRFSHDRTSASIAVATARPSLDTSRGELGRASSRPAPPQQHPALLARYPASPAAKPGAMAATADAAAGCALGESPGGSDRPAAAQPSRVALAAARGGPEPPGASFVVASPFLSRSPSPPTLQSQSPPHQPPPPPPSLHQQQQQQQPLAPQPPQHQQPAQSSVAVTAAAAADQVMALLMVTGSATGTGAVPGTGAGRGEPSAHQVAPLGAAARAPATRMGAASPPPLSSAGHSRMDDAEAGRRCGGTSATSAIAAALAQQPAVASAVIAELLARLQQQQQQQQQVRNGPAAALSAAAPATPSACDAAASAAPTAQPAPQGAEGDPAPTATAWTAEDAAAAKVAQVAERQLVVVTDGGEYETDDPAAEPAAEAAAAAALAAATAVLSGAGREPSCGCGRAGYDANSGSGGFAAGASCRANEGHPPATPGTQDARALALRSGLLPSPTAGSGRGRSLNSDGSSQLLVSLLSLRAGPDAEQPQTQGQASRFERSEGPGAGAGAPDGGRSSGCCSVPPVQNPRTVLVPACEVPVAAPTPAIAGPTPAPAGEPACGFTTCRCGSSPFSASNELMFEANNNVTGTATAAGTTAAAGGNAAGTMPGGAGSTEASTPLAAESGSGAGAGTSTSLASPWPGRTMGGFAEAKLDRGTGAALLPGPAAGLFGGRSGAGGGGAALVRRRSGGLPPSRRSSMNNKLPEFPTIVEEPQ